MGNFLLNLNESLKTDSIVFIVGFLDSVAECFLIIITACKITQRRFENAKHYALLALFSVIYGLIASVCLLYSLRYEVDIIVGTLMIFSVVLILSSDKFFCKLTSVILSIFFYRAIDFIVAFVFISFLNGSNDYLEGISIITEPGVVNLFYLTLEKLIMLAFIVILSKIRLNLSVMNKKSIRLIFVLTLVAEILLMFFSVMMTINTVATLRITSVASLIFTFTTVIAAVISISVTSRYEQEKNKAQLMETTNLLLEQNYSLLRSSQQVISSQVHDFKNHLIALSEIVNKDEKAYNYIQHLIADTRNSSVVCQSGNDIIDAIINSKIAVATEKGINFGFEISLPEKIMISPVDICAVLANQLDNAIEACERITDSNEKKINVHIGQQSSFLLFKVENTVKENPFLPDGILKLRKKELPGLHGIGIPNIERTAKKYNGYLKNDYKDGIFISTVMLSNDKI